MALSLLPLPGSGGRAIPRGRKDGTWNLSFPVNSQLSDWPLESLCPGFLNIMKAY